VPECLLHALVTLAGEGVGELRVEEGGGVRGCQDARCLDAACEVIRQLSVFMLTRRSAALAAIRPTLLFKLE
jgi:hypothetical protein